MNENHLRAQWKVGSQCHIFSASLQNFFPGVIVNIFTDTEGEWLEVTYHKSMSKQVQRYSKDIQPHANDLMAIRKKWTIGHTCEIFSQSNQEWFLSEIAEIEFDEEGEWLHCHWSKANASTNTMTTMSKQVQRYSNDVRPTKDLNNIMKTCSSSTTTKKRTRRSVAQILTPAEQLQLLAREIAKRKSHFIRKAPRFSSTITPSQFTYPATKELNDGQSEKLEALPEIIEDDQYIIERLAVKQHEAMLVDIESMTPKMVIAFIKSLGCAYDRYVSNFTFRNICGKQLLKVNEADLQKIGIHSKLHRNKILSQIDRSCPQRENHFIFKHDHGVLSWNTSKIRNWCLQSEVLRVYAHKFFNHGIDGILIFDLDVRDLSVIGVDMKNAQSVLKEIKAFGATHFSEPDDDDDDDDEKWKDVEITQDRTVQRKRRKRDSLSINKKQGLLPMAEIASLQKEEQSDESDCSDDDDMDMADAKSNDMDQYKCLVPMMGRLLIELANGNKNMNILKMSRALEQKLNELREK